MADDITITLPDGSSRSLPPGATALDLAGAIGPRLARAAVAARVDGQVVDLGTPLADGEEVAVVTGDTDEGRHVLRHSTAHVLAQAVTSLWPGAKYAIGPAIENGFYYDFELPGGDHFSDEDLARITARMREIVAEDQPFVREEHTIPEGLKLFVDQPYKLEIIQRVEQEDEEEGASAGGVSAYRNTDDFVDLCRGPHVPSTGRLGSFALQRVAGAYWRGDEHRQQLQRIYGTAWESDKALKAYLAFLEEAEKRDHRRLGAELDLFSTPPELGGGLVLWHPKGARIRRLIEDFSRDEHDAGGYQLAFTPHLAKSVLWEISGHLDWYADGMYPPMEMEGARYYPKPMNCPFHILIFKSRQRSYRELPLRIFELGTVYRYERSGVLHGLFRVRGFTQDDSHIFCTLEQMGEELISLLGFILRVLRTFGFTEFEADLSTRPLDKSIGSEAEWDAATDLLRSALDETGLPYGIEAGGGAFYGPKIDVHIRDAIGRKWQLSTIQVDFQMPQLFELEYTGADNTRHRPVMIHRALLGSIERFFGILVEHFAGAFPAWLAPVQVHVLPLGEDHEGYAEEVVDRLTAQGFRAETAPADEPLGGRIRKSKLEKLPYILVVGPDDVAHDTVGVNARGSSAPERDVPVDEFAERLHGEVETPVPMSDGLGRLWAGWRNAYVTAADEGAAGSADPLEDVGVAVGEGQIPGCVLCRLTAPGAADRAANVVWRGKRCAAVLNAYPYTSGHLMVLPVRHVGDLEALEPAEASELWAGVTDAVVAIKAAYRPGGVNVGLNLGRSAGAGVPGHLHVHALPRWDGDTNFMTTTAGVRVLPEALPDSWAKLRAAWPNP